MIYKKINKASIINKLPKRSVHQHSPSQPRVWLILPRRKGKNPKESCAKLVAKFPQRPESVSAYIFLLYISYTQIYCSVSFTVRKLIQYRVVCLN